MNKLFTNMACRPFSINKNKTHTDYSKFETVFTFPFIKYIAVVSRLKTYHLFGTSIALPGCGLLEILNVVPENTFFAASYIGVTGAVLLSLGSLPFRNTIGYIYISEDNKLIKISSVDFWGKRKNRIISSDEWIPILDLKPKAIDAIYLTPQLTDGTKYKLFVKYGNVLNSNKMGDVLE